MLRFVRRSTKPDKKEFQKIAFATGKNFRKNFSKKNSKIFRKKFKIFEKKIQKLFFSGWFSDYGIHRILRQADSHSHQQYYSRITRAYFIGLFPLFYYFFVFLCNKKIRNKTTSFFPLILCLFCSFRQFDI